MIPPSIILALLIGSMIGLAFFYAFGRKADSLFACWLVGAAAFLAGQVIGSLRPLAPFLLGDVHVTEGTVVCLIALVAVHFARR
jgi:hypothetical protein